MKRIIIKLTTLLFFILVTFITITQAQYYDAEKTNNNFTATTLDFELQGSVGNKYTGSFFDESKLEQETTLTKSITVVKKGELGIHYAPHYEYKEGSEDLCNDLKLTASKNGTQKFTGSLSTFNLATQSAYMDATPDEWEFSIANENDNVEIQGLTCTFDIVFNAYQNSNNQLGFSDTEKISNTITTAYEPKVTTIYNTQLHTFSVKISNLQHFDSFNSTIKYIGSGLNREVSNFEDLNGENERSIVITLGSCSNNVCTYDQNPHDFEVTLRLVDSDGHIITINKHH